MEIYIDTYKIEGVPLKKKNRKCGKLQTTRALAWQKLTSIRAFTIRNDLP
jgi:hypothetical protein